MVDEERIGLDKFNKHVERIAGYKITRVWLGYADVLFLECGRLKKEKLPTSKGIRWSTHGQITFMLDCQWRVEKKRSIDFGISDSTKKLENRIKGLVGLRIASVSAVNRVPELCIELDDGRCVRTFTAHRTMPAWFIGFNDLRCIDVDEVWKKNDVDVWLSFERGGYCRSYCFDEREFKGKVPGFAGG